MANSEFKIEDFMNAVAEVMGFGSAWSKDIDGTIVEENIFFHGAEVSDDNGRVHVQFALSYPSREHSEAGLTLLLTAGEARQFAKVFTVAADLLDTQEGI
jgi:hypothetical protein